MEREARSLWLAFITAPENEALFKRYAKSAQEPEALFDNIGEDLDNNNEHVREQAFWALVAAMPELTDILHVRESERPGWRDGRGADQRLVNRGMDVLSKLHLELVKNHKFTAGKGGRRKDPRPYVRTTARRWQIDEHRRDRQVPLDEEFALSLPDPRGSAENEVLENISLTEFLKELLALGFLNPDELDLFWTVYVDDIRIDEASRKLNITSPEAARKRLSRARMDFVTLRDGLLAFYLHFCSQKRTTLQQLEEIGWDRRALLSLAVGQGKEFTSEDSKENYILYPITRKLGRTSGQLYLVESPYSDVNEAMWDYYFNSSTVRHQVYANSSCEFYDHGRLLEIGTTGIPCLEEFASKSNCFLFVPKDTKAISADNELVNIPIQLGTAIKELFGYDLPFTYMDSMPPRFRKLVRDEDHIDTFFDLYDSFYGDFYSEDSIIDMLPGGDGEEEF